MFHISDHAKSMGLPELNSVDVLDPKLKAGAPELWNCLKQQLEGARRKGYFAPQTK